MDVRFAYGARPVLDGLSGSIAAGSLTAVLGPNGSGKSTLLKGVARNVAPRSGRIVIDGSPACRVGYLPQQADIDATFPITVGELVAMGLWHRIGPFGSAARHRKRTLAALATVGLTGLAGRQIASLSGGQKQRMLFARLILQDAPLLLLDEPFNAIDEETTGALLALVRRWHAEGRTVLAVLHDLRMAAAHFPDALLLARRPIAMGPTGSVIAEANLRRAYRLNDAAQAVL